MRGERLLLARELTALGNGLPKGSIFHFEVRANAVFLERLSIPRGKRGCGTRFLAEVFCACDRRRLPTEFVADATDLPNDPVTFELVNFYRRFGAEPRDSEDGWPDGDVGMRREAGDPKGCVDALLDSYDTARALDLTTDEFEALRRPPGRVRAF